MTKLSNNDILNLYKERKNGKSIHTLCSKYKICDTRVEYLIRLIDKHGFEILRKNKNKYYPPFQKEEIINRVLINNESITSVAIDEGLLSKSMLNNWIKKYKENCYNIVERKRGRTTMPKVTKKKSKESKDETIKRLQEENLLQPGLWASEGLPLHTEPGTFFRKVK